MPDILGYARASTGDQDLAGQRRRLESAGAFRIFEDVISGKLFVRPGLAELLRYIRPGDTLAVVRLTSVMQRVDRYAGQNVAVA